LTKIFTPFCRSRRVGSKYIYFQIYIFSESHKVFFYYNYIIDGKNPKIDRNIYNDVSVLKSQHNRKKELKSLKKLLRSLTLEI